MAKFWVDTEGRLIYSGEHVGACQFPNDNGLWTPIYFFCNGDYQCADDLYETAELAYERAIEYFS